MLKSILRDTLDSSPLFARLLDILEAVERRTQNRMRQFGMIGQAFEFAQTNGVQGDYLEFGVWRGKVFRYAHRMKRRYRVDAMKLWAFDSFAGLPDIDEVRDNVWKKGDFACSEDDFKKILKRAGVRKDEYELVQGFYKDSLNDALRARMQGRTAAIVYIDCDLYESTIDVLNYLPPYLVNGTIICFDDYYCYKGAPDRGEQRAIVEFLGSHARIHFIPYFDYAPAGKSFIVRLG